jgi:hypothetical protein
MKAYLKQKLKGKRTGNVGQGVECLPSKCEVLSSIQRKEVEEGRREEERKGVSFLSLQKPNML